MLFASCSQVRKKDQFPGVSSRAKVEGNLGNRHVGEVGFKRTPSELKFIDEACHLDVVLTILQIV